MEWITFADAEEVSRNGIFMDDDDDEKCSDVEESNEPQQLGGFKRCSAPVIGLHWDTSAEILSHPDIKKPTKGSTVKQQLHYLFKSPIDSFFALIPYIFGEIFYNEIVKIHVP